MSTLALERIGGNAPAHDAQTVQEREARRAAAEFESLLLAQLTSALKPSGSDDEEGLFSSGTSGFYAQMFNEQFAKIMSEQGGIGLTDAIVSQMVRKQPGSHPAAQMDATARALSAVRAIKSEGPTSIASSVEEMIDRESSSRTKTDAFVKKFHADNAPVPAGIDPTRDIYLVSEANPEDASDKSLTTNLSANADVAPVNIELFPSSTRPRRVFPLEQHAPVGEHAPATRARFAEVHESVAGETSFSDKSSEPVVLMPPIEGHIKSNFGMRRDPFNGQRKFHAGVDIPAPLGTPVGAAADGKVVFAGRDGGYGNTVVIEHRDGRRTRYAHAQSLFVRAGESVEAGQPIAAVGSTGRSTGPHLHFEVIEGGRQKNPLKSLIKAFTLARR